ncbi:MAG: hypothetical protein GXO24_01520 [Chlorobi bacterium]|nr:hypothetical protein [Chlorobiota bacterium]
MNRFGKEIILVFIAFLLAFVYAWLRYVTFGPYTQYDFLLILNKATAFSIILILFLGYSPVKLSELRRDIIGKISFFIALAHVIISLILLPTDYYKKYHLSEGQIMPGFAIALIFGIISILSMLAIFQYFRTKEDKKVNYGFFKKLTAFFFGSLFLHIVFFGYKNWWDPSEWYGGFPPITLISVIMLLLAIPVAMYFLRKKMQLQDEDRDADTE